MLIDLEKNHVLMFKILKSIYIFESRNRFIYEQSGLYSRCNV